MPPLSMHIPLHEAKKRLEMLERLYFNEGSDENGFDPWTPDLLYAARMNAPSLHQAAPNLMDLPDEDTFLYRFLMQAMGWPTGRPLLPQFQKFGTCVGQSSKLKSDIALAIECLMYQLVFPGRVSVATSYTGGRVEIARQPGAWEGSNCAWSIDFDTKFGLGLLKDLNLSENSLDEDENLAMSWTKARSGVPQKFEDLCRVHPIKRRVRPVDAREVGKGIQAGIVFFHGSNMIPTGNVNAQGFSPCKRSRGGHAVCWPAVRYNPFGLLYWNSWGPLWGRTDEHTEGAGAYVSDQPLGSVWVDEDEANAIIAAADTFGATGVNGLTDLNERRRMIASIAAAG